MFWLIIQATADDLQTPKDPKLWSLGLKSHSNLPYPFCFLTQRSRTSHSPGFSSRSAQSQGLLPLNGAPQTEPLVPYFLTSLIATLLPVYPSQSPGKPRVPLSTMLRSHWAHRLPLGSTWPLGGYSRPDRVEPLSPACLPQHPRHLDTHIPHPITRAAESPGTMLNDGTEEALPQVWGPLLHLPQSLCSRRENWLL